MNRDLFEFGPSPAERRRTAQAAMAVLASALVLTMALAVPLALRPESGRASSAGLGGLGGLKVYRDLMPGHTEADVDYDQIPPAGGLHDPEWLDCGIYDSPVPDENAVHDLEHGTVWITYRPGLAPLQIGKLASLLPEEGIMSPYDGLPAPIVITVWERQLGVTSASDPRLLRFLAEFGDGQTAPEPLGSCGGGLSANDLTADL